MRYRQPIAGQRLTMLTGRIERVEPAGIIWSYGGRNFGPSPIIAPALLGLSPGGDDAHTHELQRQPIAGRGAKILANLPDYSDAVVIPLAYGGQEWQQ